MSLYPDPTPAYEGSLHCPKCGRKGTVRWVYAVNMQVRHDCPGPWVLSRFTKVASSE